MNGQRELRIDRHLLPALVQKSVDSFRTANVALAFVFLVAGCGAPEMKTQPPEPPLVTVEKVQAREIDSYLEFTGYLRPVKTQEIRAQVTGYLKRIGFKDGDIVKSGDVLYEIDPEPYIAALKNSEAGVEKAKADVINANATLVRTRLELERGETLRRTNSLSIEDLDSRRAARDVAIADLQAKTANVLSAEATLRKAKFDLENCCIRSAVPGFGRVSRTLLTEGNLIVSGTTQLCTVTSLDPIYAYFDVDEMTSLMYRRMIYDKKEIPDPREPSTPLKCWIGLKDEAGYPHAGSVAYIAPEIGRDSGTREIYGVFANPDYRFTPGDSVRVKLESGSSKKFITVPEIAVGSQQQQKYVFVVVKDKDGQEIPEIRPVTLGAVRQVDNVRLQIIESGLNPGELVVVNGLVRVRPGKAVKTVEQQTPVTPK